MSSLQILKQKISQEKSYSESWYQLKKIEEFEHCSHVMQTHYSNALTRLLQLEKHLSI